MGSAVIALVREIGRAIGERVGVNKVRVTNTARQNKEHMEAGSERGKRQDFTINNVQGQKLITTEFECRNLVLGISEVMWE